MSSKRYTTRQVAEILGTAPDDVASCANRRVIKASKNRLRQWVIPEGEIPKLNEYLEAARKFSPIQAERNVVTPCPEAKEVESGLYQCPKIAWLRVRKGAQICISCERTRSG